MSDTPAKKAPPPLPAKKAEGASTLATRTYRSKLEPWMIGAAEAAIRQGLPLKNVAGVIGVSARTLSSWLERAQEEGCDPLLAAFGATIEHARAEVSAEGVRLLKVHALSDPKALVELLRAQDPETWSPQTRSKVDVTVTPKAPLGLPNASDEELRELAALEARAEAIRNGVR